MNLKSAVFSTSLIDTLPTQFRYFQIILLSFLLCGCESYTDHSFNIPTVQTLNVVSPKVSLGIVGKNQLEYDVVVECKNTIIGSGKIIASSSEHQVHFPINLSKLKDKLLEVSVILLKEKALEVTIKGYNASENINLDTSITVPFVLPPISIIEKVEGKELALTSYPEIDDVNNESNDENTSPYILRRATILKAMILEGSVIFQQKTSNSNPGLVNSTHSSKITVYTDTIFKSTFIARVPAKENISYKKHNISILMENLKKDDLLFLVNDVSKKLPNGNYEIQVDYEVKWNGPVSIFLVNVDENGIFFAFEVAKINVDGVAPRFNNLFSCGNSNEKLMSYEGLVCLKTEHFFGYNPYKIPFVGNVYGDVKLLYVDGKRVQFKKGQELYFKKYVYLDGGYNRIPVKIIDEVGNVGEYFIPITLEAMNENDIDINNEIYIEHD